MPADQLTALDATFLELEEDDEGALMHIGAALVFDPLPGGGAPTIDQVREHVAVHLDRLPRYRQKLTKPRTGGFAWPSWERDPRFELDAHIRHATLPAPGDEADLLDWISDYYSHRLDRSRPLWEIALLDGLARDGWALVWKTHHCVADGVGSVGAVNLLLDTEAGDAERPAAGGAARDARPQRSLPRPPGGVRWTANAGMTVARAGTHALLHPREALERSRAVVDLLVRDELVAAPRTSLNEPIGATRRVAAVHAGREQFEAIRADLGGKLNDVVLYAATGGLRALLLERDEELPQQGLRAMVPVNVRPTGGGVELGNRVSSMFVELPVAEADPRRRYERIRAASERHKTGGQAQAAGALIGMTELAPPMLHAGLARMLYASRLFNVTITNVPGPAQRVSSFGAPMTDIVPIVPLAADHAVGIAVISYVGKMTFGLNADRASVPDLGVLADGIAQSVSELAALVLRSRRSRAPRA
ncbi:MAG TPA: wax ester/triacylglycerol synthase family O-acyltransferase [Solirubrobacteraceae bacterium]|nr:wax ester/triacylglycerol synthase family O-acyltransferase [Solirubrobacteraceae bacterium]